MHGTNILLIPSSDDWKRIRRETTVLTNLDHPNIINLLEVIETDQHICIVTEYADGGDLYEDITQQPNRCLSVGSLLEMRDHERKSHRPTFCRKVMPLPFFVRWFLLLNTAIYRIHYVLTITFNTMFIASIQICTIRTGVSETSHRVLLECVRSLQVHLHEFWVI